MIKLYQCNSCWYVFDEVILHEGKHLRCECGDGYFRRVNPTFLNVVKYIVFHRVRALKRMWE